MSLASTLLRVVLMLSLLLNGLNMAMAGGHGEMPRMAQATAAAGDGGHAHCQHHASLPTDAPAQTEAPPDNAHCQIKDCLRSCAQQPLLAMHALPLANRPVLSQAPLPLPRSEMPAPPPGAIHRPPIA